MQGIEFLNARKPARAKPQRPSTDSAAADGSTAPARGYTTPMEDKGTPARDHHDLEDFEQRDDAVSDQQGETAPPAADEPKDGARDAERPGERDT